MQYITTKTLFRIKLLFLIGTIVIVGIVILDIFYHTSDRTTSLGKRGSKAGNLELDFQRCDELLHARLWQLQDMDQHFAAMVTSQNDQAALTQTNASIQLSEEVFRKSIDSISRIGASYDEQTGTNDFQNMITFFKKILENRRFIAFTRTSIISGSAGNEKQTILKLQNELYEKERLIAASGTNKALTNLQAQLAEKEKQIMLLEGQVQKEQADKQTYTQTTQRLQNELAEKDKIIASLGNKSTANDQKALVNLQTELTAKNKQINTLQNQLQTDKQSYTLAVQRLQADVTEKDKIIAAAKKLPTDQRAVANLQNEITAKNKQIGNLQAQLQSEKQSYSQTVQKLQVELTEKDRLIASNTNKKLPADQKAVANLQTEIAAKNKQIADLQTQVQKEQSDKKSYAQTIQKYQGDLAQKSKMIDALSNIKIPTDDKAVASLQKELGVKNKQISDLQAEVDAKNKVIASSSRTQPADQKGLAALQNELTTKNRQIDNLQNQLRKETAEKQGYSKTINDLQVELIEKNKLIAAAGNRKVPSDQKALVTLQNEIVEKDKRIRALEGQLQGGVVLTKASGGESVRDLEQRNTNLRLAYNSTMTQLGVLQKKYNVLKAEMDQMKGQQ